MTDRYLTKVLSQDERVLVATRQHRLFLLGQILSETVLAITLATLITFAWRRWDPHPMLPWLYLLLLFPAMSVTLDVLRWKKQQFLVTSRRVVEISGILNKTVTDSSLEKINDIKLTQSLPGRMFNFGSLEILTASEAGLNRFENVHRPLELKKAMLDAKESLSRSRGGEPVPASTEAGILGLMSHLDQLRDHGALTQQEADRVKAELLSRLKANA